MKSIKIAALSLIALVLISSTTAQDDTEQRMAAAERWIDEEFTPSAISREEQLAEMEWFIQACEPYRGMEITSVAENIRTHTYESDTLTQAFNEICGINVTHDIIGEGRRGGAPANAAQLGADHLRHLRERRRPHRHTSAL